jgi:putative AdoMet-dependent methyltransferase
LLGDNGRIVIADIAFKDMDAKFQVRQAAGESWEEEYYWIAESDLLALQEAGFDARFYPVSSCGGIFFIRSK